MSQFKIDSTHPSTNIKGPTLLLFSSTVSETKPIQSILRGIDILEMLSDAPYGLRLSDIAEAMDLKMPTVHNLVKTLASRGLVEKLNSNLYAMGPRILEMSDRIHSCQQYVHAEASVRRLAGLRWQPTVNFSVPIGDRLVVRMRMSPDRPNLMQRPVGQVNQIYSSASGLALLAFAEESIVSVIKQAAPFHDIGIRLWNSIEALDTFLAEVQKRGYAETPFEGQELYRVAAPVFDKAGDAMAIIGVGLPIKNIQDPAERKALAEEVVQAAKTISAFRTKVDVTQKPIL